MRLMFESKSVEYSIDLNTCFYFPDKTFTNHWYAIK